MTDFSLECFQNEFLSPGGDHIDAIVTVTSRGGGSADSTQTSTGPRTEIIMIDVSGSMTGKKIREACQAAAAAVDCVDDGVRFALIAGNHQAWRLYPSIPGLDLAVSSPTTRAEARQAVTGLRASGGTAMGAWLNLASGLLRGSDGPGINHAILLTDGRNESEKEDELRRALDEAAGRFQCDCRGVGTDWAAAELIEISTALLGSVDIVADPDGLVDDFTGLMHQSMGRDIGRVELRLWIPTDATVAFVKQVSPEVRDLAEHATVVDGHLTDYATGAWGDESRDYHVSIKVRPGAVGEEMLAGRVTLMADGEPAGKAQITAIWTEDRAQSTRINRQVAHYTGQEELAELVQDGMEAWRQGDIDEATRKLGPAVRLAAESGNHVVAEKLAEVVDVEDAATGKVTVKRKVEPAAALDLEIGSTKTARVRR